MARRPTARQKRLYLYHHGEFQHQNCAVGLLHGSDHDGVVGISVGHSYLANELFIIYAAQFFPYQECNVGHYHHHLVHLGNIHVLLDACVDNTSP